MSIKDIDRIYEKGLETYKETPSSNLWSRLNKSLDARSDIPKKTIPKWLGYSVFILPVIALIIFVFYLLVPKTHMIDKQSGNEVIQPEKQQKTIINLPHKSRIQKNEISGIDKNIHSEKDLNSKEVENDKILNNENNGIINPQYFADKGEIAKNETSDAGINLKHDYIQEQGKYPGNLNVKNDDNLQDIHQIPLKQDIPSAVKSIYQNPLLSSSIDHTILDESMKINSHTFTTNSKRKILSRISIELSLGGSIINNTLKSPAAYDTHVNIRKNNEDRILTPSINMNLRYSLGNFNFITGISYSTYGEKTNYTISQVEKNHIQDFLKIHDNYWVYDTINYIQDPYNPALWYAIVAPHSVDTSYIVTMDKDTIFYNINKYSNRSIYSYFEIPFMIGTSIYHNKFSLDLSSGFSFGFLSGSSGYILDLNNLNVVNNSGNKLPLNKTSMNFLLSAGISYNRNSRVSFVLQTFYKQQLTSLFKDTYPVDQKFHTLTFCTGIRYYIK